MAVNLTKPYFNGQYHPILRGMI